MNFLCIFDNATINFKIFFHVSFGYYAYFHNLHTRLYVQYVNKHRSTSAIAFIAVTSALFFMPEDLIQKAAAMKIYFIAAAFPLPVTVKVILQQHQIPLSFRQRRSP